VQAGGEVGVRCRLGREVKPGALPPPPAGRGGSDNAAKMACRAGSLRALREAAYLLWADGGRTRLCCDWCELMGATALLTLGLPERGAVLAPGAFGGIDGFRQQRGRACRV
jgi:hypothetical protein